MLTWLFAWHDPVSWDRDSGTYKIFAEDIAKDIAKDRYHLVYSYRFGGPFVAGVYR